jgi:hypothetical protein
MFNGNAQGPFTTIASVQRNHDLVWHDYSPYLLFDFAFWFCSVFLRQPHPKHRF